MGALRSAKATGNDPEQRFREVARSYIKVVLANREEYKSILLSTSPAILEQTSVLFPGARLKRQTVAMACQDIKALYGEAEVADAYIELTAQVLWAAAFGLALRMVIEDTPTTPRVDETGTRLEINRSRICISPSSLSISLLGGNTAGEKH